MESIVSVGIDIGTTTTQVVFSRLFLVNTAGYFAVPSIEIVEQQSLYRGAPNATPLKNEQEIDAERVRALVENEYLTAGMRPDNVATGAVIITGETAKKSNAAALLSALSALAGDFVVETAGPDLEAVIAGKGSGAAAYSKRNRCRVLNIDIGGGTSNAALFDGGEPVSTGCIEVGGHHVQTDLDGRVLHLTQEARRICAARGISLRPGERNPGELTMFAAAQAELLEMLAGLRPKDALYGELVTPGSAALDILGGYDDVCLSGGVSDAAFGAFASGNDFRFGDTGILLGRQIASGALLRSHPVVRPDETIRATVIGAGAHTLLVSGSTIDAAERSLPQRNVPVLRLSETEVGALVSGDASGLERRLRALLAQRNEDRAAIALSGERDPSYATIRALATAIAGAADRVLSEDQPLIVVLEQDMAKALGQVLRQCTRRPVIAIDRVSARENDRIDIGALRMNGRVAPVVVKTLVFAG